MSFDTELRELINRHSRENGSNTPDYLLADYLRGCLEIFDRTVKAREAWYGRKPSTWRLDPAGDLPPLQARIP